MSKREDRLRRQEEQRAKQHARQAKVATVPNPQKLPKAEGVSFDEQTVQWCFEIFDHQTDWRINKNDQHDAFCTVGEHLRLYSAKTWRDIRRDGDRDHASAVDKLCREARERLADLHLDDLDELWRFRFSGTRRIWGIKVGRLFRVLWWDPDHQVYPTQPRN